MSDRDLKWVRYLVILGERRADKLPHNLTRLLGKAVEAVEDKVVMDVFRLTC